MVIKKFISLNNHLYSNFNKLDCNKYLFSLVNIKKILNMKKIKVVLATFVLASLTLTSCSSDDNSGSSTPASIIGEWNPTTTIVKTNEAPETEVPYEQSVNGCDKDYVKFVEAGNVFNRVLHAKNADTGACLESPATPTTWAKVDDELTIAAGQYAGTYEITVLNASELRIKKVIVDNDITTTTTRVFKKN